MKRMETSSATDGNGSQERIFKAESLSEGQEIEDPSIASNNRRSTGPSQLRFGYSARKSARSRSRSGSGAGAAQAADDTENQFEYGITKQVEITIVEERSERQEPSDTEGSPVSGSWPLGNTTNAEAAPASTRDLSGSTSSKKINK